MAQDLESQEGEPIPEIVFTGTSLEYLQEMVDKFGKYKQESGGPTYLSGNLGIAFDAATNRSYTYKGTPVVMVVDATANEVNPHWNKRIGFQNDILCDEIPEVAILGVYKVELTKRGELTGLKDPVKTLDEKFEKVKLKF